MKNWKKYIIFCISFLASLYITSEEVYASPLTQITFDNTTKVINSTFDKTFSYEGYDITVTQTDVNKANFCVANDCYEYTFPYNIYDNNNYLNWYYQAYFDTSTGNINFRMDRIRTITNSTPTPNDHVYYYGYSGTIDIQDNYITSTSSIKYIRTCTRNNNNICSTNFMADGDRGLRYKLDILNGGYTWETLSSFNGTGTNQRLFFSNISTGVCINPTCATNGTDYTDSTKWAWYNFEEGSQYNQKYESENLNYQIKNFDIYYKENESGKAKLELYQIEEGNSHYNVTTKNYGHKCENNTCYWEEINNIVTNVEYTQMQNDKGFEYTYEYNVTMSNYDIIKLAIIFTPKEKYKITYYDNTDVEKEYDLNYIGYKYSLNKFEIANELKSILIQKKTNNLEYLYVAKEMQNFRIETEGTTISAIPIKNLFPSAFVYDISKLEITDTRIDTITNNLFNSSTLDMGYINITDNQALYLALTQIASNNPTFYGIYFTDDVIYTDTKNLNFEVTYNGTTTNINTINSNSFIQSELSNVYELDFDSFKEWIISYKQYKDKWLELFNSIWQNLNSTLQMLILYLYFMGHCIGIFILFKD